MAIYKTSDLLNMLSEIINDGYEYVEVMELDAEDDIPAALNFSAIDSDDCSIDYDNVESVEIPDDYDYVLRIHPQPDDICHIINFTYEELFSIHHAINNALEYMKDCLKDPSCTREIRDEIKSSSIEWRNLQAKFAKFFKKIIPR